MGFGGGPAPQRLSPNSRATSDVTLGLGVGLAVDEGGIPVVRQKSLGRRRPHSLALLPSTEEKGSQEEGEGQSSR